MHFPKVYFKLVKELVLKLDKSKIDKLLQLKNISTIVVTFDVSKLDNSKEDKEWQL